MSAFTNTLLIFIPAIGAAIKSYILVKENGDLLTEEKRFSMRLIFAASAGTTIFFFVFYLCLTIGIPVDLDFVQPGIVSYPWWLTPASLLWTVIFYKILVQNTMTFGERE